MNQRFQNAEIKLVSEQYADNELYKAISMIGPQLESEYQFGLCAEECFMDTLELLSVITEKGKDILAETDNIWLRKYNEYKRFDRHVDEEEIRKAVGIVFGFIILVIDSSRRRFYRFALTERLTQTIVSNQFESWQSTLERIFSVPLPDGWFDTYLEEEPSVSLPSSSKKSKTTNPKKKVERKPNDKPKTLKYYTHGNNGVLRKQRKRVDIVFSKWNEWGWLDDQTATTDVDAFFEGEPRHCNITWKASTTVLTFFLQKLLKQPYIAEQKKQSASSMVRNQFGLTPSFDASRLADDDEFRIKVTVYLLNIDNPLPLRDGGYDDDYETTDAALQAILSGQLRSTKGI